MKKDEFLAKLRELAAELEESARMSPECSLRDTADRVAEELSELVIGGFE